MLLRTMRVFRKLGGAVLLMWPLVYPAMASDAPAARDAQVAEDTLTVDLGFEFYFGGLHVLSLAAEGAVGPTRYQLESELRTRGLTNLLFRSVIRSHSSGSFAAKAAEIAATDILRPVPQTFETASDGRWGARRVTIAYADGDPQQVAAEPPYNQDNRAPVGDALRRDTVDPQTAALLSIATGAGERSCGGSVPVFDGRRRYNLNFTYLGADELHADKQGFYTGPAMRCRLVYERIAGFDEAYAREHGDGREHEVTIWIAAFADGRLHLPVRMMADTRFGKALGHLRFIDIDASDKPVRAAGLDANG
jgi:hypothetical protein